MRLVERLAREGLLLAALLAAAGCATKPADPPAAAKEDATPAAAAPAPAGQPTMTAAAAGKPQAVAAAPAKPALPAEAQRSYEQAQRSIAAGRLDEAERMLLQLTQAHPDFAAAQASLGAIYRRAGKLEPAVQRLERATQGDSPSAQQLNELGIAYRELGKFEQARESYERAIGIDPAYAAAQLNLGILLDIYLWDGAGALAAYERYLALAGNDEKVGKWIVELRNRRPAQAVASRKEAQ
jgi:tetratricopeptide (TPR) repeat protein